MTYLGLKTCPNCNGTGEIYVEIGTHVGDPEVDDWDEETCPDCDGTGEIEDWEDEDDG